jgi:hypothetical protein
MLNIINLTDPLQFILIFITSFQKIKYRVFQSLLLLLQLFFSSSHFFFSFSFAIVFLQHLTCIHLVPHPPISVCIFYPHCSFLQTNLNELNILNFVLNSRTVDILIHAPTNMLVRVGMSKTTHDQP